VENVGKEKLRMRIGTEEQRNEKLKIIKKRI